MMTRNIFLLSAVVLLFLVNDPSLAGGYCQDQQKDCDNFGIQGRITQQLSDLSTDFETGSPNFWADASQTGVRWKIEDSNSTWELNNTAPKPLVGRNYMRVNRGVSLSFGVAVLRSQTIQVPPSSTDTVAKISFDFWIRSKWPQFTNLELYLNENGNEKLIASLSEYSNINNTNWMTYQFRVHPFRNGSASGFEFSLAFYAYCGTDREDAVAIDNIRWIDPFAWSSTSSTVTPSTAQTTVKTTSTEVVTVDTTTTTTEKTITTAPWINPSTTQEPECYFGFRATPSDTNITSTEYPNFYETNQSCFYHVGAEHVAAVIRLRFNDIDMGTDDFVKVYDGFNSPEILKLTGNSSLPDYYEPPKAVADCQSGVCLIEHFSGSSLKGTLRGWRATYSECGGEYFVSGTQSNINITSPNYPNFYHIKQTCYYEFSTNYPMKIRLKILDFEMEDQHDWFKVYDGRTRDSLLLFKATGYPGSNTLPYFITSSGSQISIEHISDYSDQGSLRGWSVNILEID